MRKRLKILSNKLSLKHKNNRVWYYFVSFIRQLFPEKIFRQKLAKRMSSFKNYDAEYILRRVNYYNKLEKNVSLSEAAERLEKFRMQKKNKTYFFDCYEYTRYFQPDFCIDYRFGDVIDVPPEPSIVKSRPISNNNENSVILNLDKVRHFTFVKDKKDFRSKKDMLVSRNYCSQPHRLKFLQMYINHPLCNIGKTNISADYQELNRDIMTIDEQLEYKFILCLEGNDVATNLKWVMSSHSLAVMTVPKYETWFMEGTLIPDYHYMRIKDDYSDLQERMEYFMAHPLEAMEIIKNANNYIDQFKSKEREDLISLMVLEKYFIRTNQKKSSENLNLLLSGK